jgi:hypothetical protein
MALSSASASHIPASSVTQLVRAKEKVTYSSSVVPREPGYLEPVLEVLGGDCRRGAR